MLPRLTGEHLAVSVYGLMTGERMTDIMLCGIAFGVVLCLLGIVAILIIEFGGRK